MRCILLYFLGMILFLCNYLFAKELIYATWNVRYANSKDSINGDGWEKRVPVIADMAHFYDFDILSVQEPDLNQVADLAALLPEYDYVQTNSRYFHPIFYKKGMFSVLDSGMFWYSESGEPGSIGWNASQKRFCSWVKFSNGNDTLFVFNGHWDHKSWEARKESAKLTIKKIKEIAGKGKVVFSGDLNVEPKKEPYNTLRRSSVIEDSRVIAKYVYASNNSFNGFDAETYGRWHIDYVFVSPSFNVMKYGVLNDCYYDGNKWRHPSDHSPVMIKILLD